MAKKRAGQFAGPTALWGPSKLTEAHRNQLKERVDAEALTSRALVSRLATECRITISASTLRTELK